VCRILLLQRTPELGRMRPTGSRLDIAGVVDKSLWMRRIFARISPNLPKSFCATFACKFSPIKIMKTLFWCDLQKKVFMCFSTNVGRHFLKSNNVGRDICPDFQGFCPNFQRFCPTFQLIKTFGGALALPTSPPPTPLPIHFIQTVKSLIISETLLCDASCASLHKTTFPSQPPTFPSQPHKLLCLSYTCAQSNVYLIRITKFILRRKRK